MRRNMLQINFPGFVSVVACSTYKRGNSSERTRARKAINGNGSFGKSLMLLWLVKRERKEKIIFSIFRLVPRERKLWNLFFSSLVNLSFWYESDKVMDTREILVKLMRQFQKLFKHRLQKFCPPIHKFPVHSYWINSYVELFWRALKTLFALSHSKCRTSQSSKIIRIVIFLKGNLSKMNWYNFIYEFHDCAVYVPMLSKIQTKES